MKLAQLEKENHELRQLLKASGDGSRAALLGRQVIVHHLAMHMLLHVHVHVYKYMYYICMYTCTYLSCIHVHVYMYIFVDSPTCLDTFVITFPLITALMSVLICSAIKCVCIFCPHTSLPTKTIVFGTLRKNNHCFKGRSCLITISVDLLTQQTSFHWECLFCIYMSIMYCIFRNP